MRIPAIEQPKSWFLKLVYWISKQKIGKVITPIKVVYARIPRLLIGVQATNSAEENLKLERSLGLLIKKYVAQLNECHFCMDIAEAVAIDNHIGMDKFDALDDFMTSPLYSDRERAALIYAAEVNEHKQVSDATFAQLKSHFTDTEIVEITWLIALENYYNFINIPLQIESDGLCAIRGRKPTPA